MTGKSYSRISGCVLMACMVAALSLSAMAQKDKSAEAKSDVTGHYEGTAKNNAGEVIMVAFDLAE